MATWSLHKVRKFGVWREDIAVNQIVVFQWFAEVFNQWQIFWPIVAVKRCEARYTGCPKKNVPKIVWIISPATNMLDAWDMSHLKGRICSSVWSTKKFSAISGSRDIRKSKLYIIIRHFRYWFIFCLEIWCLILFCLYFGSLMLYRNGFESGLKHTKGRMYPLF